MADAVPFVLKLLTGGAIVAAAPRDARWPMAVDFGAQLLPAPVAFPVATAVTFIQLSAIEEQRALQLKTMAALEQAKTDLVQTTTDLEQTKADLVQAKENQEKVHLLLNRASAEINDTQRAFDGLVAAMEHKGRGRPLTRAKLDRLPWLKQFDGQLKDRLEALLLA